MPVYLALQNMFLRFEAIITYKVIHSLVDSLIHSLMRYPVLTRLLITSAR